MRTWKDPDDMLTDFDLPVLEAACAHGIIDYRYCQNPLGAFTCGSISDPGLWLLLAECGYQQVRPDEADIPEGDFLWLRDRGGLFVKPGADVYPFDSFYASLFSSSELGRRGIYRVLWGHVNSAGAFYATEQPLVLENERTTENMELVRVARNEYGTFITRPDWVDSVRGLDFADDEDSPFVTVDEDAVFFDSPDNKSGLLNLVAGERIMVTGGSLDECLTEGVYRAVSNTLMVPVLLVNWGVARVRVQGNGMIRLARGRECFPEPVRLTGESLHGSQGSEWMLGAATAALQLGAPYLSGSVKMIPDGDYVVASLGGHDKVWLKIGC